ncbi:hypothetical protein [Kitasatospora sp. NPDC088134]|uniref:hypothetical protein n=1 Tax=Kitasatospora sp. NPDC088134 TaxID=3364071 RepID=UPI0038303893
MSTEHPLVGEEFPELVAELAALLTAEDETALAEQLPALRLVAECGCGDDFCQSFATAPHPPGTPCGPGHRCVPLLPERGMLALDVLDGRIVYVEVLERPPLRRT